MASRSTPVLIAALLVAVAVSGCNRPAPHNENVGAGTTQPGFTGKVEVPGGRPVAAQGCDALPDAEKLEAMLREAPEKGEAGGFAGGRNEWAAVVDRNGVLCAIVVSTKDPAASWPGSQAIAKAFTANGFSSDAVPMSTARLYTMSLPGHSLWTAGGGNPLNPECLNAADKAGGVGKVCGGTIAFGGGLPLYQGKTRVGGLGLSGDTPCADHEIAKRVRAAVGLDPVQGAGADDIIYSSVDGPSLFTHPLCKNTWRDGKKIGDEPDSSGF